MKNIYFVVGRPPLSAAEVALYRSKAAFAIKAGSWLAIPMLVLGYFFAKASYNYLELHFSSFIPASHVSFSYLLFLALVSLAAFFLPFYLLTLWVSPWREIQYKLSPIDPLFVESALRLSREHSELEVYRRSVVAVREFTNGDYDAMTLYSDQRKDIAFVAAAENRQRAAVAELHATTQQQ